MAQAGCGSQTHPAGKPTPALSNCLHRRGQAGVAGGKRYGGFAPENDIARACAAASGVERGDSGCGGQSRAEAAGATQSQQPAFEWGGIGEFWCGGGKIGRQASWIGCRAGGVGAQTQPLSLKWLCCLLIKVKEYFVWLIKSNTKEIRH